MKKIISVLGGMCLCILSATGQNTTVDFSSLYNNSQSLGASVTEKGFTFFGDDNNNGQQSGSSLFYTTSSSGGGINTNLSSSESEAHLILKKATPFDFIQVDIEEPSLTFLNMEIDGYLNGVKVATKTFALSSGANETVTFDNTFNNVDEVRITGTDGFGVYQYFDKFVFGPAVVKLPGELVFLGTFEDGIKKEGDSDSTAITLNQEPTSDVVLSVSSINSKLSFNKDTLTFTKTNWNIAQNVIATAIDNKVDENTDANDTIRISVVDAISADEFDGLKNSTRVQIANDDKASFVINQTNTNTTTSSMGTKDSIYVKLLAEPQNNEVITATITLSADNQVNISSTTITIDTSNWKEAHLIVLEGLQNTADSTFNLYTDLSSSTASNFDKLRDSITVTNKYIKPLALFSTNKVNEVKAYPLPATNQLTVQTNSKLLRVTCRTVNGQKVEVDSIIESNKVMLNTSALESGMYFIQLETIDNKLLSKKVIIE